MAKLAHEVAKLPAAEAQGEWDPDGTRGGDAPHEGEPAPRQAWPRACG